MKLFVVHWSKASQDERSNSQAFGNIHGVYRTLEQAQNALIDCRNDFMQEIIDYDEFHGVAPEDAGSGMQVYGSVEEGHFEIDNDVCDFIEEIYIAIEETELN